MNNLRREDLSLHHYLKYYALSDFIETESNISLVYSQDYSDPPNNSYVYQASSSMVPSPLSRGRGWSYIDSYGDIVEQTTSVYVYDATGTVISGTNYDVDYVDGRIILASSSILPSYTTYKWHYVSVVNEWDAVQSVGPPVVAVDIPSFTKSGFQLGGGKFVSRDIRLHIFASNQAERDDLTESLYDALYLKSCPFQEFNTGTMIDWDGRFNSSFTYTTVSGCSNLKFDKVRSRNTGSESRFVVPSRDYTMLSNLNRYRASISFDMFYWSEAGV